MKTVLIRLTLLVLTALGFWAFPNLPFVTPTITSLSPSSATAGDVDFTLTVDGTDFVSSSVVQWNGAGRSTTFVSSTQLTAAIPASDLTVAGVVNVTVDTPDVGGGTSGPQTFTINNPTPTLTGLSPTSATAGDAGFTLTVNGTDFVSTSIVQWNGVSRTTTFVSSTQLTATILVSDLTTAGVVNVTVDSPAPGGGTSSPQTFTINNPNPTIISLSPSTATVGDVAFTLTINGTGFVSSSVVQWNGASRTTTFVSSTQLTAAIPAADIATAGTATVTVNNPTPGGGTSTGSTFTINNPLPILTSISPASKIVGDAAFTLIVNGTGFVSTSVVQWNGSSRTTTFVSSTQLTAAIPASDLTAVGTVNVTVSTPAPGGGTSSPQSFTINNPTPTITSLSPSTATAGDVAFTLTVNGTGFVSNSVVQWNGASRTTTFASSTQLKAAILAADIATAGTATVTVNNPTPGGGTSTGSTFTINNPLPTLTSISPASKIVGDAAFTLTVNGTNFVSSSVVRWNGASRTTTFVSSTQLTAAIPATDIATAGTATVTVNNPTPGGGTSTGSTFTINNPLPILTSISPASKIVGDAAFTLTVNGTGFVSSSVVLWNGISRTTTFVSSTQLTAAIPASDLTAVGTVNVTVNTPAPGGGTSSPQTFTINNPSPTITSLSPSSAIAGNADFILTVNGTNFVSNSVVQWNGAGRTTTFVSSTQLTAAILAADIATAGTATVTVNNPTPGGGTSTGSTFTINNPLPILTSISPASKIVGDAAFTLTVNGTGFVSTSVVQWNGSSRTTTFVSSTQLTAAIPASDIATAGTATVTVNNPTPGGGTSTGSTFTINNPLPILTSISPASKIVGDAAFTLTVNGTGFVSTSVVQWNGVSRTTTFVSSTQLTAAILASDLTAVGTVNVTVSTPAPGGGISSPQTFTINNPTPTITSLSPSSATAGDVAFTLTVNGTGFVSNSVVQWNGASRTTTFASSTQLKAAILAADIATAGTATVTVNNPTPGGGTSTGSTFTINNPLPTLTSISPASKIVGDAAFTLTVNGTNFVSSSVVRWNGASRTTTFVSSTQLTAAVPASDMNVAGTVNVTVNSPVPGGGTSSPQTFTINNPTPTITSLSPSSAIAGDAGFTLTVNGTGFVANSVVQWNGASRTTTYVSSAQLTATIPASDLTTAGTVNVIITTPAPGGGTSSPQTFTINNPTPTITSLSPSSATAGNAAFTLTVNGTSFVSSSVVQWNGASRTTTFVSSTQLTAAIPASDIATVGTASVSVNNPTPGGGTSTGSTFTITPIPDTIAPQAGWATPVGNDGSYTLTSRNVLLAANASDNIGVTKVRFFRWDFVHNRFVDIGYDFTSPYQWNLDANTLYIGFNEIDVEAYDAAGNKSPRVHIFIKNNNAMEFLPIIKR